MEPEYDVFISHAGEDKDTIAIPIYEALSRRGINAFVDREELRTGNSAPSAMLNAVDKAAIGLFILSPEYGSKRWPMLELDRFLQKAKAANEHDSDGTVGSCPVLIPLFYRLPVADCKDRKLFDKYPELLHRPDTLDRLKSGATSVKDILDSLAEVSRQTGIENKAGATNDDTDLMKLKRNELVETVCDKVSLAMHDVRKARMAAAAAIHRDGTQQKDVFQPTFYVPRNVKEVLLDFSSALTSDIPNTKEAELLQSVLTADGTNDEDRVIVIKGDGGVGKSCMLRGLGEQDEVRRRFVGGVYYISLGMDASIDRLIEELLKILRLTGGRSLEKQLRLEKSLDVILESIGRWMKKKQILVLVDDLWEGKGLGGWVMSRLVGILERRSRSVVVVTTRMSSIAMAGRVIEVTAREALSRESRSMLLGYSRFSEEEVERWGLDGTVEDLLLICGGLPVCIGVVGRAIAQLALHCTKDKWVVWKKYYRVVSENREAMVKTGIDEYSDLMTSLTASLEVLEESKKGSVSGSCKWSYAELHRGLSVLPKPAVVPIEVVCRLWGLEDELEALMIVKGFADVGLAGLEVGGEESGSCVRLHDLIHDFAVECSKRAGDNYAWHKRILEGYCRDVGVGGGCENEPREWWKFVDDKYLFQNVCRHLVLSGRVKEAVSLLMRCEWAEAQHNEGGLNGWKGDFEGCLKGLEGSGCLIEDKEAVREGLCCIRDAVVESWSYVQGSWSEFGFQMWGRLNEEQGWVVSEFLESVEECVPRPWLKPLKQRWVEQEPSSLYARFNLSGEVGCIVPFRGSVYAVGAGRDIWMIDIDDKRMIRKCEGHKQDIEAIGVNAGAGRMISYSWDGTLRHWDIESGEEVQRVDLEEACEFANDLSEVNCASVDALRNFIVTGSVDGRVDMWDINTGAVLGSEILVLEYVVETIAVSSSGRYVAAGSLNGVVQVVDRLTGEQLGKTRHEDWVVCVTFSPDESMVASASFDHEVRLWYVQSGSEIEKPFRYTSYVKRMTFSTDGKRIALGLRNGSVIVRDIETKKRVYWCYEPTFGMVYSIQFGRDSHSLLVGYYNHRLRVLRLDQTCAPEESVEEQRDEDLCDRQVTCLQASPDGSFYVSGSDDGSVVIWDSTTYEPKGLILEHGDAIGCVAISSDSRFIASGCGDGKVRIWNADTHEIVSESLGEQSSWVSSVAFSPNGELIISGSEDGSIRVWRAADGKQIRTVNRKNSRVKNLCGRISSLGSCILNIRKSRVCRVPAEPPSGYPACVAITPDGNRVISCWTDDFIRMWDLKSGRIVCQKPVDHDEQYKEYDNCYEIAFEDNKVSITHCFGTPDHWFLDDKRGMTEIPEDQIRIKLEPVEDENYMGHSEEIALTHFGNCVVWRADRQRLGTLPVEVFESAWWHDARRGLLVLGGSDGRVYFNQVML